jgi:hypothetical protein
MSHPVERNSACDFLPRKVRAWLPSGLTMRQIGFCLSTLLTACARHSSAPLPSTLTRRTFDLRDSVDRIAYQITRSPSTRCTPQYAQWGCTTGGWTGGLYSDMVVFFDRTDQLVAASREWQARGAQKAVADSLQASFTRVYGEGHDCYPPGHDGTGWTFMRRQWHVPRFAIQLIVGPSGPDGSLTSVHVAFVRGTLSCSFGDWYRYSVRPVRVGLERDVRTRWWP